MTDQDSPYQGPPPYANPLGDSAPSPYGCPPPYSPYATAQLDGGPPPYAAAQAYAPSPYAAAQAYSPAPYAAAAYYGGPSPYFTPQSWCGPAPYKPAPYAAPAPYSPAPYSPAPYSAAAYAGPAPYRPVAAAQQSVALGWSMWRFNGGDWELIDDRSQSGASPGTPDPSRGKFVGQIVRTPSVAQQRREPIARPSVLDSENEISDIVRRAGEVPGYASEEELRWIVGTAAALPAGSTWVEIGALCGRSFLAAGLSLPQGATLITVDRFLGQQMRRGQTMLETYRELSADRWDLRLVMTRADSVGASSLFADQSCAVVYIDADHTGPAVRADIHAWKSKVVPGGMLCGHDYGRPEYTGLTLAVDELQGSAVAVDSIWVWHP